MGSLNLIAGIVLLQSASIEPGLNVDFVVVLIGWLVLGCFAALHFGKVMRDRVEA
jgi:hypothetical protein